MQDYLEYHKLKITALAPIFVGDGKSIGKKEYIRLTDQKKVIIPDIKKMFADITVMGKTSSFADYMLYDTKKTLGQWMVDQRIPEKYIKEWTAYTLDAVDAFKMTYRKGKPSTPKEIRTFVKDAYGMPYIPGSTIKGLIRTAIIVMEVKKHPERFKNELEALRNSAISSYERRVDSKTFLIKETEAIEIGVFNILNRNSKPKDAVNSVMSGVIVSDSAPIQVKQLTLSQKIDYSTEGNVNALPILRETIIPGTEVMFDITIDKNTCKYTLEEILNALDELQQSSYEFFYRKFGRGSNEDGTVWIGGGAGFLSKTLLYAVYGEEAVEIADAVFRKTIANNYNLHRHNIDVRKGLSPHVCKCTFYHGQLYDMGMGKIEAIE